jgi:flagellin
MAITIASNIQSLQAQRQLGASSLRLTKVYERLSSGFRINRAADDAAGLAIAEGLKVEQRIALAAVRNANDGVSIISITDGALGEITNVLGRMAELSEQSANGVFSVEQRSALQLEFSQLGSEIERIAYTTEFNGIKLLSSPENIVLQVGFDSQSTSQIAVASTKATLSALGLAPQNSSTLRVSIIATSIEDAQSASRQALDSVRFAISSLARLRGSIGASESRLRTTINNLLIARENFASAESQIRDADVAADAAELTRLGILQQTGASILGQANQQPSLALQLLG